MDIYHGFFTLNPDVSDVEFADDFARFMEFLRREGKIESWRLMRRKLGLGPREFGEFHIMIEVENLAQLDAAFAMASRRAGDMERHHFDVNSKIADVKFALYRDFPDPNRLRGEEMF
ncbi:MAG: hypothetical protein OXR62_14720 [Ahrensia sp.]|nr:hypothetical protein [Ahrensia sp.]